MSTLCATAIRLHDPVLLSGSGSAVFDGYRRLGITGTRWLVDSEVYPEKLVARGLDFVSNSPLPTLDSTRLLARAALRRAVAQAPFLA